MGGPENIRVIASGLVDGIALEFALGNERNAEQDGSFTFDFTLPVNLRQGVGSVTLQLIDGSNVETLVRPIPIVLRDVAVDFYPEGGDLVLGVANRVYFQAYTGTNRPVDIQGRLLERVITRDQLDREVLAKQTREITRVHTLTDAEEPGINQGLGAFTFVPEANRRYKVKLDAPVGTTRTYTLPTAKKDGVVLHLPQGVVTQDIPVTVYSTGGTRELLIGAYCRGKLLDHTPVLARDGEKTDVVLHPAVNVGGVHRVTVFEKQSRDGEAYWKAVAERLLFRKPAAQLHVAVRPDRYDYAPGDSVYLDLEARNEKKQVVPAVTMVAVTDASVQKLANEKSARSMPTHFLLATEIRQPEDLENADALLGDHPRAAQALDLLLGAQGWRRFAEQDPQKKFKNSKDAARGSYVFGFAQPVAKVGATEQQTRDQVDQEFVGKFVAMQEKLAQKERRCRPRSA